MLWMCFLTVHSAMKSDWDISRLLSPAINRSRTSISLSVSANLLLEDPSPGRPELVAWLQGDEAGGRAVVERHLLRVHPRVAAIGQGILARPR